MHMKQDGYNVNNSCISCERVGFVTTVRRHHRQVFYLTVVTYRVTVVTKPPKWSITEARI